MYEQANRFAYSILTTSDEPMCANKGLESVRACGLKLSNRANFRELVLCIMAKSVWEQQR